MDLRLELMRELSRSRESRCEEKLRGRFGRLQDRLGKRRDDRVRAIRRDLERDLRKLRGKRRDGRRPRKPDVIQQHADPKSELYAPRMCLGEHPARRHETILQKRFLSEDYAVPCKCIRVTFRSDVSRRFLRELNFLFFRTPLGKWWKRKRGTRRSAGYRPSRGRK